MLKYALALAFLLLPSMANAWTETSIRSPSASSDSGKLNCEENGGSPNSATESAYSKYHSLYTESIKVIISVEEESYSSMYCPVSNPTFYRTEITYKYIDPIELSDDDPAFSDSAPLHNHIYTDEQCNSQFGGSRIVTGSSSYDAFDAGYEVGDGACSLTWSGGVGLCGSGPDGDYCAGDFTATSTGEPAMPEDTGGSGGGVSTFDPPDYMTPVDQCSGYNCVTIDGQTYEVDQDALDNGTVTIGGDGGGGDGSGGDGGSGDNGGGSDGDGSGSGDGFDDTDIIGAIRGLGNSIDGAINGAVDGINDAFDDLVNSMSDKFNEKLDQAGQGLEDGVDSFDQSLEEELSEDAFSEVNKEDLVSDIFDQQQEESLTLMEEKARELMEYIDGAMNSYKSLVSRLLPDIPSGSCSSIQFGAGDASFTVDCSQFRKLKSMLAWVMYLFTAYSILDTIYSYRAARSGG